MPSPRNIKLGILSLFIAGFVYLALPETCLEPARRTAFIFVLAALFWAFEIIPLYATSLGVVLMLILGLARPGGVLDMDQNGYKIFLLPFSSPVVMLFFGGFMLAAAMHKYGVDHLLAKWLLKLFGNRPYFVMLGFMVTTACLSMWLSNTATAAMMIVMVGPLLSCLDSDDAFRKALALSIPFGANIGGIGTPVGTPPNAIAVGILSDHGIHLNFLSWMLMAVPLASVILILTSVILGCRSVG